MITKQTIKQGVEPLAVAIMEQNITDERLSSELKTLLKEQRAQFQLVDEIKEAVTVTVHS